MGSKLSASEMALKRPNKMAVWKLNRMVNDMQTPRFCRMEKIAPQQFEGAEAFKYTDSEII
jgi:hypothetical protein